LTVSLWYRPDERPPGPEGGHRLLTWSWGGLSFLDSGDIMMQYRPPGGSLGAASTSERAEVGVWHHVAGVVDQDAGSMMAYLDGASGRKVAFNAKPGGEAPDVPWRIGIHYPGSNQWRWAAKGTIDSIRIYNRALGPGEIVRLRASEAPAHGR
jgi:hypothetical protein